jgi:hypothetical protein
VLSNDQTVGGDNKIKRSSSSIIIQPVIPGLIDGGRSAGFKNALSPPADDCLNGVGALGLQSSSGLAKQRTEPEEEEWPLIITDDFR